MSLSGNPPYNAGQVNENDNNKNRKYLIIDKRVSDTYAEDSNATLLRKLSDPYIKAFRLASDRIGNEGIVAFVSNSSFVSDLSFDGMRKNLVEDFDEIYILDLGGNVRKNPKLSGTTHNVFGIQVGVSINILVRKKKKSKDKNRKAEIFYTSVDEFWKKEQKYDFLEKKESYEKIKYKRMKPDKTNNWLTEGMSEDFDEFIEMGSKTSKSESDKIAHTVFKMFSLGVSTNRDSVVYDFSLPPLLKRMAEFCDVYNNEVQRFERTNFSGNVDEFVDYSKLQWSSTLKNHLKQGSYAKLDKSYVRTALYRPYMRQKLYCDPILIDRPAHLKEIFPLQTSENENRLMCISGPGSFRPFQCIMANSMVDLHLAGDTQCFPFLFLLRRWFQSQRKHH